MVIPKVLNTNILNIYGEKGQEWLNNLPSLLKEYEAKLRIRLGDCYPDASFNYVAPAKLDDGMDAVLKCSLPNESQLQEASALNHFNGQGCIKLLFFDGITGTMLLEKANPGELLEYHFPSEEEACKAAVDVMHRLHKPLENNIHFPTLNDWFTGFDQLRQRFDGRTGPFPEKLIEKAQKISKELLGSTNKRVLLHGDLHYANILSSDKYGWIAIDPKGVIGEPEFEIPLPRLGNAPNKNTIQQNIDRFIAISGFDKQRITNWLFVKATLAAWWSFEDSGKISKPFLECAKYTEEMLT